jgi:hypothetical protein
MGQNVNYLLGGQNQLLGADPELYRQQLIQQEQQRIAAMPAMNQLGATVGGLLGRGIGNLVQDRNFFEVTNPVLQKLTKIQEIYDTSIQQSDPNDPLSFYTNLQKNFAGAGLGQQAMMAQVEGKKFEETNLKGEKLKTEVYTSNPQLLDAQIAKARTAGDNELADRLAQQRGQIQVNIDMARQKDAVDILLRQAQTEAQRAQAANLYTQAKEGKVQIVQTPGGVGPNGVTPPTISVFRDGKLESQTPVVGPTPPPATEVPKKGEKKDTAWFQQFTAQGQQQQQTTPTATGNVATAQQTVAIPSANMSMPSGYQTPGRQSIPSANIQQQLGFGSAPTAAPTQIQYTPEQYRDAAILRLNPNINLNALSESDKQIIAKQLGL